MSAMNPSARHYRNQVVRIAEIAVVSDLIENVTFKNCVLIGPAVLALVEGVTMSGCEIEGTEEGVFWVVPAEREYVVGAVGLRDCRLYSCHLQRIGLAIPERVLPEMRRGFGFSEA
ncbi:hypothetical protein [Gordonia aquimaris]|uniref:Uncharacterized protein n=1 Tax=Gordonia aquimaris TaxID=2984863 RepID=A0A9X3D3N0_9ACTN|nr:hypothetical protein [Gordonia aquimaris]MCX2963151.1 hypothetical protein [Gordonia aquimaris]